MARSKQIISAVKLALKQRGLTYRALASQLEVSESTVKQMFANANFSLQRLDRICDVLETDIDSLLELSAAQEERLAKLSIEHEQALVDDAKLLLVAFCLVTHWSVAEILSRYDIGETEIITLLAKLDKMRMIELQPNNRVRLLITNNFGWQPNGPVERYFRSQVQTEFFDTSFDEEGSLRVVKNGVISAKAQLELQQRMIAIDQLFDDIAEQERKVPLNHRHGVTMILAIRNWQLGAFRELERGAQ